ncbi:hypothetical protein L4D76_15460 [Photobacterium sagamiensis]|uniref:hypothetical protein n=1 Tax=Photobacterium sagamiensis TaxID=2910241 RepID=UPI003D138D10
MTQLNKLLTIFIALLTSVILTGCAPQIDWYETTINNPRTELDTKLVKGMTESEVHAKLGVPEFQAKLTKHRKIERYYSEHLEFEQREIGSNFTERKLYLINLWYKKGKLVAVTRQKEHFKNIKGRSKPFDNQSSEDYYLHHPYVSPHYNMGLEFDYAKAQSVKLDSSLPEMLWVLGAPNRIVNSVNGEIFVYEYGRFDVEINAEAKQQTYNSYDYNKAFFVVREGKVVKKETYAASVDLSLYPEQDEDLASELSSAIYLQTRSIIDRENCLEHTPGGTTCDPLYLDISENHPELNRLYYHVGDLDFGDLKQQKLQIYQNILANIEKNESDEEIDLLYVYRSAIPSSLIPGKSTLGDIFARSDLKPYYQQLSSPAGDLAKTWLNLGQPNKWYFNSQGKLIAGISFSLISPASPWYALGPYSMYLFSPGHGAECTMFSDNCLKSISEIYKYNLATPEL